MDESYCLMQILSLIPGSMKMDIIQGIAEQDLHTALLKNFFQKQT